MAGKGQYKSTANARSKRQREYQGSEEQKKNRAARNKARREAEREGRVRDGDGKEVDHKRPFAHGGSNHKSNTRVIEEGPVNIRTSPTSCRPSSTTIVSG